MDIYKISNSDCESNKIIKIKPINGYTLEANDYFKKTLSWYNQTGKLCTPGEIGCSLSHISIYEKIVLSNRAGLIFESDISPTEAELSEANDIISSSSVDFIHLGWHPSIYLSNFFKGNFVKQLGIYKINPFTNFHGAYSYYVTPRCAGELLSFHKKAIRKADTWDVFFAESKIIPYFYPVFAHPPVRTDLGVERLQVNNSVYSLKIDNIIFFCKKIYNQKFRKIIGYYDITPERVAEDRNRRL